jgi:hypothetical protein
MADVVVTVPRQRWLEWIREGDAAGDPESDRLWAWHCRPEYGPPPISQGERLYICAWGRVRGYAPLIRLLRKPNCWALCRRGGAVAVTIEERVRPFRGWRERWWSRDIERPFPDWRTKDTPEQTLTLPGFER